MSQLSRNQPLELLHQLVHLFGREVEPKQLNSDEALATCIVAAEDGAERSSADLMKNLKWPERVRRRSAGGVRVQWSNSSGRRFTS